MNLCIRRPVAAGGFTLIELLVVLLIMGVLAGVAVPATGRFLDGLAFRKQAREITATLRYARLISISRGLDVHVRLDEIDDHIMQLTGAVEENRQFDLGEDDRIVLEPEEIVFSPEGQATAATMTFFKAERVYRIRLDLLTGLPLPAPPPGPA